MVGWELQTTYFFTILVLICILYSTDSEILCSHSLIIKIYTALLCLEYYNRNTKEKQSTMYISSHQEWKPVKTDIVKFCEANFHTETKFLKTPLQHLGWENQAL